MEIKTELDKSKLTKFYQILFWYENRTVPNSWCGLTWLTLFGLIVFIPSSVLVGFFMLLHAVGLKLDYIEKPKFVTKIQTITNPIYDKISNFFEKRFVKVITLSLFLLMGYSFTLVHKLLPQPYKFIWGMVYGISVVILIAIVLIILAWLFSYTLNKIAKTAFATNTMNKIEMFWDIFLEKYCPMINWKQNNENEKIIQ